MPYTKEKIQSLFWSNKRNKDKERLVLSCTYPGSRYKYDFEYCKGGGWMQFDTDQDASYFGVWVNPEELVVLTYAEGDLTAVICKTPEAYNKELAECCEFYDEAPEFTAIQGGSITEYYQDRNQFFATIK